MLFPYDSVLWGVVGMFELLLYELAMFVVGVLVLVSFLVRCSLGSMCFSAQVLFSWRFLDPSGCERTRELRA